MPYFTSSQCYQYLDLYDIFLGPTPIPLCYNFCDLKVPSDSLHFDLCKIFIGFQHVHFLSAASGIADIEVHISVRPSVCPSALFDHFPEVQFERNRSRICIIKKLISGHRSRGRPKSGSTGTGDKLVIFGHFFALFLSPPTVFIGEC